MSNEQEKKDSVSNNEKPPMKVYLTRPATPIAIRIRRESNFPPKPE